MGLEGSKLPKQPTTNLFLKPLPKCVPFSHPDLTGTTLQPDKEKGCPPATIPLILTRTLTRHAISILFPFFFGLDMGDGYVFEFFALQESKKKSSVYLISSLTIINQSLSHHYLIINNYIPLSSIVQGTFSSQTSELRTNVHG